MAPDLSTSSICHSQTSYASILSIWLIGQLVPVAQVHRLFADLLLEHRSSSSLNMSEKLDRFFRFRVGTND